MRLDDTQVRKIKGKELLKGAQLQSVEGSLCRCWVERHEGEYENGKHVSSGVTLVSMPKNDRLTSRA